jgi:hypothetical protein
MSVSGNNSSGAKRRKRNDYEKKQKKTSIGTDKEGIFFHLYVVHCALCVQIFRCKY